MTTMGIAFHFLFLSHRHSVYLRSTNQQQRKMFKQRKRKEEMLKDATHGCLRFFQLSKHYLKTLPYLCSASKPTYLWHLSEYKAYIKVYGMT